MLLEVFGFIGICIIVMIFYAEYVKFPHIGITACIFLLILGLWLVTDVNGIQVYSGASSTTNYSYVVNCSDIYKDMNVSIIYLKGGKCHAA